MIEHERHNERVTTEWLGKCICVLGMSELMSKRD